MVLTSCPIGSKNWKGNEIRSIYHRKESREEEREEEEMEDGRCQDAKPWHGLTL